MSRYILINRVKVQNANAVAGFTWGFPSITHFMGFTHNLSRKLGNTEFEELSFEQCGVISHEHHVHMYGGHKDSFTQSKNPPYMKGTTAKDKTPSVIEEGKMNMTVSLLIGYSGYLGDGDSDSLCEWLRKQCFLQRLAGGTILAIGGIQVVDISELNKRLLLKRKLLPGFVLVDRSEVLEQHYEACAAERDDAELIDAWLDFSTLKSIAKPKSDRIQKHLKQYDKTHSTCLFEEWSQFQRSPSGGVSHAVREHFEGLESNKKNKELLAQWQSYLHPDNKTLANWEYLPKPSAGYLVPLMTGYKAISPVYKNADVDNTRDYQTDVRFVESVHSIGEWRGVNQLRSEEDFRHCLWEYSYEGEWYLCQQSLKKEEQHKVDSPAAENPDDELA